MKRFRLMLDILLLIALFVAPFWLLFFLGILGLVVIPYYVESVIVIFCTELLYHGTLALHEAFFAYLPFVIIAVFFAVQGLRTFLREQLFRV